MQIKSNPRNRNVAVKKIDDLFFEDRNAKRNHRWIFIHVIHPLYGICESSCRSYRRTSAEFMKEHPLPEHLVATIRLLVGLLRNMSPFEAAKVLGWLWAKAKRAVERAKLEEKGGDKKATLTAETFMKYFE